MANPWLGWLAAILVTLVAAVLVVLDVTDAGLRHWWTAHALTTDTVAGLLVLAITVQIVNQVVRRRQLRAQSLAIAAQAAIMVSQAARSVRRPERTRADPSRAISGVDLRMGVLRIPWAQPSRLCRKGDCERKAIVKERRFPHA